ncbi:hypothetical protein GO001_17950 [Streptomyces sp. NRRL B-1677]|uniref:lantibiotic dehydratase n=1 Tax=Streptomyces sp. NRRL B-1677 TaxID=2682966 RepID=UPI0018928CE5|nr:lantibiotic dehydratase [Streptomyces sp. NRRL B-1677]MBF6047096.1 hypothetical protein [Streptomyces sp. NRRL B-1677]
MNESMTVNEPGTVNEPRSTAFVVRVPAFPADTVDALRSPPAADALEQCRAAREAARVQAERCSEVLHGVVGTLPPGRDRGALLELRRSIHTGRALRARRLAEKLVSLLPPEAEEAVRHWGRLVESAERARERAEDVWEDELGRTGAAAVRTAGLVPVTAELIRSGSPLAGALKQAVTGLDRGTPPGTDTALSAYAFVARASLKSTPRGTLSAWAHGNFHSGSDGWAGDPRPRAHHAELNAFICLTLLRQLAPGERLVVNPSTVDADGALYAVTPDCDAVRRVRLDPALRHLLTAWPDEGRSRHDAARALAGITGLGREKAPNVLTRLVDAGLLVGADETSLQHPDPLRAAARRTDVPGPAATILTGVADAADATTRPESVASTLPELTGTLRSLSEPLSWPPGVLAHGAPVYADTVLRSGRLTLNEEQWQGPRSSLRAVAGWIGHADPWAAARARAEAHLAGAFGAHRPVPLTVALHELVRAAGAGVPGIDELWSGEFRLPPAEDPGLRALRRILSSTPSDDGVIRVDPVPPAPARPDSLTTRLAFYGHPVRLAGRPVFVVNSVEDGCGRADAHVRRMLGRLGADGEELRSWPDGRPAPLPGFHDVELASVADSNVNLRARGAVPELVLSQGGASPGPFTAGERLDARDCHVVAGDGRLMLRHGDRRLRLVPRGRMADFHYPPVLRLLLRMFGPPPEHRVQPVIAPEGRLTEEGCRIVPRVELGDVVLMRRTVITESEEVPRRATGESLLGYAERIDTWRRRCAIPAWSFVRAVNGPGANKHRKPMPIDLASPLGVLQIERMTRRDATRLLFQEVLPDASQAPVDGNGGRWPAEVVWEVDV